MNPDKLYETRIEVDKVKDIMYHNIDIMVNENTQKTKELETKTNTMTDSALEFKKQSKRLRQKEMWKKYKLNLIIGMIVFVIILIIIFPLL